MHSRARKAAASTKPAAVSQPVQGRQDGIKRRRRRDQRSALSKGRRRVTEHFGRTLCHTENAQNEYAIILAPMDYVDATRFSAGRSHRIQGHPGHLHPLSKQFRFRSPQQPKDNTVRAGAELQSNPGSRARSDTWTICSEILCFQASPTTCPLSLGVWSRASTCLQNRNRLGPSRDT
jgi:hypothetical protein